MSEDEKPEGAGRRKWFATTRWSVVVAAGHSEDPFHGAALSELCQNYWHPVYAFVRRRGYDAVESQDLTQGFFERLLAKKTLSAAEPERGRFRNFLLASVKNFLANEWDREQAQKRGGGKARLSLDFETAEATYGRSLSEQETPETIFERQWALTLLGTVLERLGDEMVRAGNEERFALLKPYLTGGGAHPSYKRVAKELDLSETAVKVAVHRMRRRFGSLLREEVAQTVAPPEDVEPEIRSLFAALG